MSHGRRGLGRGLDALIPARLEPPSAEPGATPQVDIDLIASNPEQPRTSINPEELQGLADSIREHGLLQPLVVSRDGAAYRLIAGERRLQAARLAGLQAVPVVIREAQARDRLELALVENIQRADLNPVEEAQAYRRLVDEHHLTQEEVARRVGKSRAAVSNSLRLLSLEPEIRRSLAGGEISEGHARALLAFPDGRVRLEAWRAAIARRLSVRELEALSRRLSVPTARAVAARRDPDMAELETRLRRALGTRVKVAPLKQGARITIECYSAEELDSVVEQLTGGSS